jgi:CO/xanthine dehydrogenase FAD-binding subunit
VAYASLKFGPRRTFCRAIVSAAVCLVEHRPRVALGGVAARPIRARAVEQALLAGLPIMPALAADCDPPDDVHATHGYRLRLAEVLVQRCAASAAGACNVGAAVG